MGLLFWLSSFLYFCCIAFVLIWINWLQIVSRKPTEQFLKHSFALKHILCVLFAVFNGRSVNKLNSRCQKTALDNDAYSFALSFVRNLTSESNCGVTELNIDVSRMSL